MAKYYLKGQGRSVNCNILNESKGDYIVQFNNGVVKNVDKRRVHSFDRIDEAVLDRVRSAARDTFKYGQKIVRKVAEFIEDIAVKAFNFGGYVFFHKGDKILPANYPSVAMEYARTSKKDFINMIPGDSIVETVESAGGNAVAVEGYKFEGEYNGSTAFITGKVKESFNRKRSQSDVMKMFERLDDKTLGDNIKLSAYSLTELNPTEEDKQLKDMNQDEIIEEIERRYRALRTKRDKDGDVIDVGELPLLIFGAPGVGKTTIIRGVIDKLKDEFPNISYIGMNVAAMGPEDITLPATIVKQRMGETDNAYIKRLIDLGIDNDSIIKDLPKSWLPVYDRESVDRAISGISTSLTRSEYKKEKDAIIRQLDCIANGGTILEDGTFEGDDGGILFIDEYTRMSQTVQSSLMNLPKDREVGANGLKIGSHWVIVAAANRSSDMTNVNLGELVQFAGAESTRFKIVNFVPRISDWLKWASSINKETGRPYIIEPIRDFISSREGSKYFYYVNRHKNGVPDRRLATASPRTWESLSIDLFNVYITKGISLDKVPYNKLLDRCEPYLGITSKSTSGKEYIGAANAFCDFVSVHLDVSDADAKDIWTTGGINAKILKELSSDGKTPLIYQFDLAERIKQYNESFSVRILENYPYKGKQITPESAINLSKFVAEYTKENGIYTTQAINQLLHSTFDRYDGATFMDQYDESYDDFYDYLSNNLNVDLGF